MFRLFGDIWSFNLEDRHLQVGRDVLNGAEISFANLETPVCGEGAVRRNKVGPHLRGDVGALKELLTPGNRYCLSLANNHMMDFGREGLIATLNECERLGAITVGAGRDVEAAKRAAIFRVGEQSVAVVARCERQFGVAGLQEAGVATLDSSLYGELRRLKADHDVVVLSVHGGAEMCPWPSPSRQATYRSFVDAGADVVHGHHSHIPQGFEIYNQGLISYGLGNFVVDPGRWLEIPNSLWSIAIDYDPISKAFSAATVSIEESREIVAVTGRSKIRGDRRFYVENCNVPLSDSRMLSAVWQEASIRSYNRHYAGWLGFSGDKRSIRRHWISKLKRAWHSRVSSDLPKEHGLLLWYHLFACESHRDAIATALGVLGGEIEDLRTREVVELVESMIR